MILILDYQVCDLYRYGFSQATIGKMFETTPHPIAKILHDNQVEIRSNRQQALKYTCNENFFNVIDTEEKAYWLGFIYADGYISPKRKHSAPRVGIAIKASDKAHLETFRRHIDSTHKINTYECTTAYGDTAYCRILIASETMFEQLKDKGVLENKTFLSKYPTEQQLPKHLQHHFARGFFDGNGSLSISEWNYKTRVNFEYKYFGTYDLLSGIKESIDFPKDVKPHKSIYSMSCGGNLQVEREISKIYKDATVYLQRKYERYQRLLIHNSRSRA